MKKIGLLLFSFLIGSILTFLYLKKETQQNEQQQAQVVIQQIKSLKKLIVTEGTFSETLSFKDTKNYMYDMLEFEKKAIVTVNAKVQVNYDLALLLTEIDSINKVIYLKFIPEPEVEIIPDIKYFDMQQSTFNTFSKNDLNRIQKQAIDHIRNTSETAKIKERAKNDLLKQLKNIYFITNAFNWEIIDETSLKLNEQFKD